MRPEFGGRERQHDPVAGDARGDQLLGDPGLGAVVLDPDLPVADVQVQDAPVDAVGPVPAGVDQFIVVVRLVDDDFDLHVPDGGAELRVLPDDVAEDAPVFAQGIHRTIRSSPGRKTTRATFRSSSAGRAMGSQRVLAWTLSGTARNSLRSGS